MFQHLQDMGSPYGITFMDIILVSNTRLSIEASEYAKAHNRFDEFHDAVFKAYFTFGRDIGQIAVLSRIGQDVGLDAHDLQIALETGTYRPVIEEARQEASRLGIKAAPTFVLNDRDRIVGAHPLEMFRNKLKSY